MTIEYLRAAANYATDAAFNVVEGDRRSSGGDKELANDHYASAMEEMMRAKRKLYEAEEAVRKRYYKTLAALNDKNINRDPSLEEAAMKDAEVAS